MRDKLLSTTLAPFMAAVSHREKTLTPDSDRTGPLVPRPRHCSIVAPVTRLSGDDADNRRMHLD